jgi:hypothetical protein
MTKHIDTGEYIQAQQERIDRLQAELQHYRTNLTNGYGGETATDAECDHKTGVVISGTEALCTWGCGQVVSLGDARGRGE